MDWYVTYKIERHPIDQDALLIRYYLEYSGVQIKLKASVVSMNLSMPAVFDHCEAKKARYVTNFRDFLLMCDPDPQDEE